jgi:hypothetical protein
MWAMRDFVPQVTEIPDSNLRWMGEESAIDLCQAAQG